MFVKATRLIPVALSLAAVAAWGQDVGVPAPGPARVVGLAAQPPSYRGPCPTTLRFTGVIEKGARGAVEYYWQKSDRTRTAPQNLEFLQTDRPQEVSMLWTIYPRPDDEVWAALVIAGPPGSSIPARRATARVICTNRAEANACARLDEVGPIGSLVRECAEQRYRVAEEALGRAVAAFVESLGVPASAESADDPAAEADAKRRAFFEESQASWEAYRRAACDEAYYEFWPGSMAATARLECLIHLTESQAAYLQNRLEVQE